MYAKNNTEKKHNYSKDNPLKCISNISQIVSLECMVNIQMHELLSIILRPSSCIYMVRQTVTHVHSAPQSIMHMLTTVQRLFPRTRARRHHRRDHANRAHACQGALGISIHVHACNTIGLHDYRHITKRKQTLPPAQM